LLEAALLGGRARAAQEPLWPGKWRAAGERELRAGSGTG